MTTGYTADVCDGKITELRDFVLHCARAFGALSTMRDAPMDAEIPDEFKPDTHYAEILAEAQAELAELNSLSDDDILRKAEKHNEDRFASHRSYLAEKQQSRLRYEAMIEKVKLWQPPSPDHEQMKTFMLDQLRQSIDFDCSTRHQPAEPKPLTATEWLNQRRETLRKLIERSAKSHAEEVDRCAKRTDWIKKLKASL